MRNYVNHTSWNASDEEPDIPIDDPYPLSEWVRSTRFDREIFIDGEDYQENWLVEFRESDEVWTVRVYPPGHHPRDHMAKISWEEDSLEEAKETVDKLTGAAQPA